MLVQDLHVCIINATGARIRELDIDPARGQPARVDRLRPAASPVQPEPGDHLWSEF